jgi:hypothetical protein
MAKVERDDRLERAIVSVRASIAKFQSTKGFNEQNTKASLIVPVLHALGWNTSDADEVHWEFRRKSQSDPVDFALLLQRQPCLFLEAKPLRDSLNDHKWIIQIMAYAVEAGVQWVVITNGDEYRAYNATAPLPSEGKLFRQVVISRDSPEAIVATLSLLSKANLQDKKINRLWDSHFVDHQVKGALEELFRPDEPSEHIIGIVRTLTKGKLAEEDIHASLCRLRINLDFPVASEPTKKGRNRKGKVIAAHGPVSLHSLVEAGVLRLPAELVANYKGKELHATIKHDGSIMFRGSEYPSPSAAAIMAQRLVLGIKSQGGYKPATNGWVFWRVHDIETGEQVQLSELRDRYLAKNSKDGIR